MTLPEYWFGPPPALAHGERWVAQLPANHTVGKRAVGGGLHITNQRLLFSPNALETAFGGRPWSCALADIAGVGIERGRFLLSELFSGGLRDRLRVDLSDGRRERFVVARPAARAAEFRGLLQVPHAGVELPVARVIDPRR